MFDLQSALEKVAGSTPLRAEIINRSLEYLDRLAIEKSTDDGLQVEVGHGYYVLADVLGAPFRPNLGELEKGRATYRKAIAILQPVAARDANNRRSRMYLYRSRAMLGRSLEFTGDSAQGKKLLEDAAQDTERLSQTWPADFDIRAQAALIWDIRARSLGIGRGFFATAENAGLAVDAERHSVENGEAALRLKPGDLGVIRQLANSYGFMGYMTSTRDIAAAGAFFRQALTVLEQIRETDRQSTIARQARGNALLALGTNLGQLGQYPEAIAKLEEALQIRERLSGEDPKNTGSLLERTAAYRSLAIVQKQAGHDADALGNLLTANDLWERLVAQAPSNRNYQLARADVQANAAHLCAKLGRTAMADRLASAALGFYEEAAARPDAGHVELTMAAQNLIETDIRRLRDPKLALEFMKRASEKGGNNSFMQEVLGQAYWLNGDRAHAIVAIQKALSLIGQGSTPEREGLVRTIRKYQTAALP